MKTKRIILVIVILGWMGVIFYFSHQIANKSGNTSQKVITIIVNNLPATKNLPEKEKKIIVQQYNHIIRKMAHFTIYMVGGSLIFIFINTFNIKTRYKAILTMVIGILYASTDEIHQLFVLGRSCEFRDICIDTAGLITGVLLISGLIFAIKFLKKRIIQHNKI